MILYSIYQKNRSRLLILLKSIVILIAFALIAYCAWGIWQRYQATHNPNTIISTEVVIHSTDKPDETPPAEACSKYEVEKQLPLKLQIDSVGIDACIERSGIDQYDAIAVPTNIHLAGYYINSPPPGQSGVSIINGHVLGRYSDAVFKNLKDTKPDEIIRIQLGDKSWLNFKVMDVSSYPVDTVMKYLFQPVEFEASDTLESQINLITCTGMYDKTTQTYDERIVVRAKLM